MCWFFLKWCDYDKEFEFIEEDVGNLEKVVELVEVCGDLRCVVKLFEWFGIMLLVVEKFFYVVMMDICWGDVIDKDFL